MDYFVEGEKYGLSYTTLREQYHRFCEMTDEEFGSVLLEVARFACVVGWFKELPNNATIGDGGIVHELLHYMSEPKEPLYNLEEIRKKFADYLNLA